MMKKRFLILCVLVAGTIAAGKGNIVELKAGFSPAPRFDVEPSKKAKASYELGAEYRYTVTDNTEVGVGIAYQNHGKLKRFTDIESSTLRVDVAETELYDSVPLYATVKYNFRNSTDFTPYVKADLGYSININGKNSTTYETYNTVTGAMVDSGTLKELDAKDGVYYSVGAGFTYRNFTADLSYRVNTAKIEGVRYDGVTDRGSADSRRITLGFGYQFGF